MICLKKKNGSVQAYREIGANDHKKIMWLTVQI